MKRYFLLFVMMLGFHASWAMDDKLVAATANKDFDFEMVERGSDDEFGFEILDAEKKTSEADAQVQSPKSSQSPRRDRVASNDLALVARVRAASPESDTSDDEGLLTEQPASPVTADLLRLMQKERDEMGALDDDASSDNEGKFNPTKKKRTRKNKKKKKSNAAKVDTFTGNESEPQRQDGVRQDLQELWDTAALLGGMALTGWSSAKDAAAQAIMNHDFVQSMLDGISRGGGA